MVVSAAVDSDVTSSLIFPCNPALKCCSMFVQQKKIVDGKIRSLVLGQVLGLAAVYQLVITWQSNQCPDPVNLRLASRTFVAQVSNDRLHARRQMDQEGCSIDRQRPVTVPSSIKHAMSGLGLDGELVTVSIPSTDFVSH